jgi:hypothetical protein
MEARRRSYARGDAVHIDLTFRFTGELTEGNEIHAVFCRADSSHADTRQPIRLAGEVRMKRGAPGSISEAVVYKGYIVGLVPSDVEPGEYICKEVVIRDLEGRDLPFIDTQRLDLVISIREEPSSEKLVVDSDFAFDRKTNSS